MADPTELWNIYNRIARAETGNEADPWIRNKVWGSGSSAFGEVQLTRDLARGAMRDPETYGLTALQFLVGMQDKMLQYGGRDMIPGMERYDYGGKGDFTDELIPSYRQAAAKIMGGLYDKHVRMGGNADNFWRVWRYGEKGAKDPSKKDPRYESAYRGASQPAAKKANPRAGALASAGRK